MRLIRAEVKRPLKDVINPEEADHHEEYEHDSCVRFGSKPPLCPFIQIYNEQGGSSADNRACYYIKGIMHPDIYPRISHKGCDNQEYIPEAVLCHENKWYGKGERIC